MDEEKKPLEDVDDRSTLEKVGDTIEDTLDAVSDAFYGDDFQHDIPATRKLDSGRRVVNKTQTRKNINKRLFGNKLWIWPCLLLFIGGVVFLVYFFLEKLLMA